MEHTKPPAELPSPKGFGSSNVLYLPGKLVKTRRHPWVRCRIVRSRPDLALGNTMKDINEVIEQKELDPGAGSKGSSGSPNCGSFTGGRV